MNSYQALPATARRLIIIEELISSFNIALILGIVYALLSAFDLPSLVYFITKIIYVIIGMILLINLIGKPVLGYRNYHYLVAQDRIAVKSGVFNKHEEILPMCRLQKVTVTSSFLNRQFGLADIEMFSAGSSLTIKKIPLEKANDLAEEMKNKINQIAGYEVNALV